MKKRIPLGEKIISSITKISGYSSENEKINNTLSQKPFTSIIINNTACYSQFNEELIIRDFFKDKKNGFFVDIGCNDYKENNTTYYLEKHLDWTGIAVDALEEYSNDYSIFRTKTKFLNYIIKDNLSPNEPFYRLKNRPTLSSSDRKIVKSSAAFWMIKPIIQEKIVPSITLTELLIQNKVKKIDFISIDIEGGEIKALEKFDILKFKPELICIEALMTTARKIMDYFISKNYYRINKYLKADHLNWYFTYK